MITIPNYTYIQHNVTTRQWGVECQFTVINAEGKYIDDIVILPSEKASLSELESLVADRLTIIDIPPISPIPLVEQEKTFTLSEVEGLLAQKGLLLVGSEVMMMDEVLSIKGVE
jgi:hypothetical protein